MNTCHRLMLVLSLAAPSAIRAAEPPVVFARAGRDAAVPLGADHGPAGRPVVLWAFGRAWTEPAKADGGVLRVAAPKVRVPVVLRVVPAGDEKTTFGELVVYPDRPVAWEKKLRLAAAAAPDWFDTWSQAVGLPVERLQGPKSLDFDARRGDKPSLVLLGRKAAGAGPAVVCRLAAGQRVNVLVLEADWFGKAAAAQGAFAVTAKEMAGPLADWHQQRWALPPGFRRRALPWPGIVNRQAWITGGAQTLPLVEELMAFGPQKGAASLRTVLSYLPWQEQLGRCEVADILFLKVLSDAAAGAKGRRPLEGRWCLLYPPAKEIKPGTRPVLAAALSSAVAGPGEDTAAPAAAPGRPLRGYVLDLRGKTPPPDSLWRPAGRLKAIEDSISAKTPLLILGDHPRLDGWKWLRLDRRRHRSPRPGVLWWPEGSLPPSAADGGRLMQLFTEWGIRLKSPLQEVSR